MYYTNNYYSSFDYTYLLLMYTTEGGQNCSYFDTDPLLNRGNNDLRGTSGVDLVEYDSAFNGVYVGWIAQGEWLSYTVQAFADAVYSVEVVSHSLVTVTRLCEPFNILAT
jgi:hypothetical protein